MSFTIPPGAAVSGNFSALFKRMGLTSPAQIDEANAALVDARNFLDLAVETVTHYRPPGLRSRIKKWLCERLGLSLESDDALRWELVKDPSFNAEARKKKEEYRILMNAGAIIRIRSLCNEISSVQKFGRYGKADCPSMNTADEDGMLFSTFPPDASAKQSARRIYLLATLFLFGHEFSHIVGGHLKYNRNFNPFSKPMPDHIRRILETDSDIVGGLAVGGWLSHNQGVLDSLYFQNTPVGQQKLIEDCAMAAAVLFVLFNCFSDTKTPRYHSPAIRMNLLLGNVAEYIRRLHTGPVPKPPVILICMKHIEERILSNHIHNALGVLASTSARKFVGIANATLENEIKELQKTLIERSKLKDAELALERPFGMPEYVKRHARNKA